MACLKIIQNRQFYGAVFFLFVLLMPSLVFSAVPVAKIDSIDNISCASADVLGAVNPCGLDTSYRFNWFSSHSSFCSDWFYLSAGHVPIDVIYKLVGLKRATEYRVSIYACNSDGCGFSNLDQFITKKCSVKVLQWQEVY